MPLFQKYIARVFITLSPPITSKIISETTLSAKKIRFNSNGASRGIIEGVLDKHNHTFKNQHQAEANPLLFCFWVGQTGQSQIFFEKNFHSFQTFPDTRPLYFQ